MNRRAWLEKTVSTVAAVSFAESARPTTVDYAIGSRDEIGRHNLKQRRGTEIEPKVETLTSIISPASLIKICQEHYHFGKIEKCIFLRRNLNDVYELRLANAERRIIRISIPRDDRRSNVEYETAMLLHLKAGGASVAAPCATTAGHYWVSVDAPEGNRAMVAFQYLEGVAVGSDLEHIKLMGYQLARIHEVSRRYDGPPSKYALDIDHLIHSPTRRIHDFCKEQGKDTTLIKSISDRLCRRVASGRWTRVACHGDAHSSNAVITCSAGGQKVASLFDFDDGGPGYLAYDLSGYLRWIVRLTGKVVLDESTAAKWAAFLEGYQMHSAIPDDDLNAVWTFAAVGHLWWMSEMVGLIRREGTLGGRAKAFQREIGGLVGMSLIC